MAIQEYKWKPTTHAQLVKCIKWCQNQFNLRDWEITLDTGDAVPKDMPFAEGAIGGVYTRADYLKANIWVPLTQKQSSNTSPLQTLVHEMLHVLTRGHSDMTEKESDLVSYRLEALIYRLYCKENGIKP